MRKIVIWVIIVLGLVVLGYLGWITYFKNINGVAQNTTPTTTNGNNTSTPGDESFRNKGAVVKNNPGLKPDTWYLIYEQPGAPALNAELSFNNNSECLFGKMKMDCTKLQLRNGSRSEVIGTKAGQVVTVRSLVVDMDDFIRVNTPRPGDAIKSPVRISGEARGFWYFEASFPVRIVSLSGQTITSTFMEAKSEWMTEEFVPFDKIIRFNVTTATPAEIILSNDNPSGLPENDREIRIPVTLLPANAQTQTVSLFYYDPSKDEDKDGNLVCSRQGLVEIRRTIPRTQTPLQDTTKLLLQGNLSYEERQRGITTEFPLEGVSLRSAAINNGVATLTFDDPGNRTGGGSCRVSILWAQVEATAKQFSGINQVRFMPEELFQP